MLKTPLHLQCQYAYKSCTNPRTQKKDGEIHKLCAVHRDRANSVQKIYAAKRRAKHRAQRKQKVIQNKALFLNPVEPIPFKSTPSERVMADSLDVFTLDVLLNEPIIEPILSPSESHSFSIEESEYLRSLLLQDEPYLTHTQPVN